MKLLTYKTNLTDNDLGYTNEFTRLFVIEKTDRGYEISFRKFKGDRPEPQKYYEPTRYFLAEFANFDESVKYLHNIFTGEIGSAIGFNHGGNTPATNGSLLRFDVPQDAFEYMDTSTEILINGYYETCQKQRKLMQN